MSSTHEEQDQARSLAVSKASASEPNVALIRLLGVGLTVVLFLLVVAAFVGMLPMWVGWLSLVGECLFVPYFVRKVRSLCSPCQGRDG